jgi:hypothetical protein
VAITDITGPGIDVGELRTRFRGALLRPGEEGYDEATRVRRSSLRHRGT